MNLMIRTLLATLLVPLLFINAWALPTPCGSTGLLTQPTSQTLNSGNICIGIWTDTSEWAPPSAPEYDATIMPFGITLGLGSFMEAYGSFPNLLFNDEESGSGRGYTVLGTKIRLLGNRSSLLQFSVDAQFRRQVSTNPDIDGLTDFLGRGIIGLKTENFGIHGWGGFLDKDDNPGAAVPVGPFEDITGYGGGIEFYPTERLRLIAEMENYSEAILGTEETGEWMAGVQFFISPHLTFTLGYGQGTSDLSPDSRILVGFSSCQGIGTYSQVEKKALPPEGEVVSEEKEEEVKTLKIKTLSPLLNRTKPEPATPVISPPIPEVIETTEPVVKPVAPVIPVMPLEEFLAAPAASSAVEVLIEDDAEIVLLQPEQNIQVTEAYANAAGQKTVSTVGTPAMASAERPDIDSTITNRAKVYRRFLMPEFAFEVNQFELTPEGSAALSMIAVELSRDNNWYAMRIDGHTDSTGSDSYNMRLSLSRAVEYAMQLTKNGVDAERLYVKGFGETTPIASNETREGRALNRRVELLVLVPADQTVPEVTEETVPEVTEETVPEVTEETVPEVTEETVPEVTEETVPETSEETPSQE